MLEHCRITELKTCAKVEVAVLGGPYGFCGCKATLNLNCTITMDNADIGGKLVPCLPEVNKTATA